MLKSCVTISKDQQVCQTLTQQAIHKFEERSLLRIMGQIMPVILAKAGILLSSNRLERYKWYHTCKV